MPFPSFFLIFARNKTIVMSRYLNPKADLTFKKVFGEHPDLVISFLNALLPFESAEEEIQEVEYLQPEMLPQTPFQNDNLVNVRCRDSRGRLFIVEMQMMWTLAFKQRVLLNASKAYVSQLPAGSDFSSLQPVYSLNLVNDVYTDSSRYYHDYRIVELEDTHEVIEGLRFIFVELPKFTPRSYSEKRMQVLWLRYLTEIDDTTYVITNELMDNPLIMEAILQLEFFNYTEAQLRGYERFWDHVSIERTLISEAKKRGFKEGMEKALQEGMEKGKKEKALEMVRRMKQRGYPVDDIADMTGLNPDEIESL